MKQMMNDPPGNCTEKEMMLWKSIQQFRLDDPKAILPFSRKLALKQNWDYDYTLQAIEEYKKFIFLCCISPHGAAPSKIIDEVWHLHLIYTQNYWEEFCDKTLQRKLHHHPSTGGPEQKEKHINWEKDTLHNYRSIFLTAPPPEFWIDDQSTFLQKSNRFRSTLQKALKYFALLPFLLIISCNGKSLSDLFFLPIGIIIAIRAAYKYDTRNYNDKKQGQDSGNSSNGSGSSCGSSCGSSGCGGGCGGCGGGGGS